MARRMLFISLIAAAFMYAANALAFEYFLYWRVWWFDIFPHVAAGISVASLASWLFLSLHESFAWPTPAMAAVTTMSLVFFAGVLWELNEYNIGFTVNAIGSYPLDTLKDVAMDLIGGACAVLYGRSLMRATG